MPVVSSWSLEEDELLRSLIDLHGAKKWSLIASVLQSKGSKQCRRRWKNFLNAELKKGGWSKEEDQILIDGHRVHGNKWTEIAKMVGGRTDNAVKNRWAALHKRATESSSKSKAGGGSSKRSLKGAAAAPGRKRGPGAQRAGGGRRRWDDDDCSDDDEGSHDDEEDEDEVSGSGDSEDEVQRRRQLQQQQQRQRQKQRQQEQQQQLQEQQQEQQQAYGRGKPPPAALIIPPAEVSNGSSGSYSPRQSPSFASAVGLARSVLASTGAFFQPLSRLSPYFQASQPESQDYKVDFQSFSSSMKNNNDSTANGSHHSQCQQQQSQQEQQLRQHQQQRQQQRQQHQQQRQLQQQQQQQEQELQQQRQQQHHQQQQQQQRQQQQQQQQHHHQLPPQHQQQHQTQQQQRQQQHLEHQHQQQHQHRQQPQRQWTGQTVLDLAPQDADACQQPGLKRKHYTYDQAPASIPLVCSDFTSSDYNGSGKRRAAGHAPGPSGEGSGSGHRRSPRTQLLHDGGFRSGEDRSLGTPPLRAPSTPLLLALVQEAGRQAVLESGRPARPQAAAPAAARAVLSHLPATLVAKKPLGLSISIPHGPDNDPVPAAAGPYHIQVFRERLTPADERHVNEINGMDLPVQIHISDEPPLSCRPGAGAGGQPGVFSLLSPGGGGNGDIPDAIDSPADWMSGLDRLLYADCLPSGNVMSLSPGPLGSPGRPTTRATLRSGALGPLEDFTGVRGPGGQPLQQRTSQDVRGRGSADAAGSQARAAARPADQGPSQQLPSLTPTGLALSPSASNLISSLSRAGGLQDGHKSLLSRLLSGAKATEEGLLTSRLQATTGVMGRTPEAFGRFGSSVVEPAGSPGKEPASSSLAMYGSGIKLEAAEPAHDQHLHSSHQDNLMSPTFMPLDVLVTPHLSVDELSSMLDFLESFDTPRRGSAL